MFGQLITPWHNSFKWQILGFCDIIITMNITNTINISDTKNIKRSGEKRPPVDLFRTLANLQ